MLKKIRKISNFENIKNIQYFWTQKYRTYIRYIINYNLIIADIYRANPATSKMFYAKTFAKMLQNILSKIEHGLKIDSGYM